MSSPFFLEQAMPIKDKKASLNMGLDLTPEPCDMKGRTDAEPATVWLTGLHGHRLMDPRRYLRLRAGTSRPTGIPSRAAGRRPAR